MYQKRLSKTNQVRPIHYKSLQGISMVAFSAHWRCDTLQEGAEVIYHYLVMMRDCWDISWHITIGLE